MQPDRRFKPHRKSNIKQLWHSHHEILRRVALGQANVEIADSLGITPQTVSNVRNAPIARMRLLELQAELDERMLEVSTSIRQHAPRSQQLLQDIIDGRVPAHISLRAKYASEELDRAGHTPVRKVAALTTTLTRDDIEAIKSRALEQARAAGRITVESDPHDAEYTTL